MLTVKSLVLANTGKRIDRTAKPEEYGRINRSAARILCTIIPSYHYKILAILALDLTSSYGMFGSQ